MTLTPASPRRQASTGIIGKEERRAVLNYFVYHPSDDDGNGQQESSSDDGGKGESGGSNTGSGVGREDSNTDPPEATLPSSPRTPLPSNGSLFGDDDASIMEVGGGGAHML